jgi:hypothetical protein
MQVKVVLLEVHHLILMAEERVVVVLEELDQVHLLVQSI